MVTLDLSDQHCYDRVATLDIETSGFDGTTEDLVAIGVGYYDATSDSHADVAVHTRKSIGGDERDLIRTAYEWINNRDPECLTSFKGEFFDLEFLNDKQTALGYTDCPELVCANTHVDLFPPRKRLAEERGKKWPSLEECLAAYDIPEYETTWQDRPLDNTRFGEELAPQYISALEGGDDEVLDELEPIVVEYTETDIEANFALYESDVGREYTPTYAQ